MASSEEEREVGDKAVRVAAVASLGERRREYILYLEDRMKAEDWGEVSDAALMLRSIDAQIEALRP